jgi:hypothetical protein
MEWASVPTTNAPEPAEGHYDPILPQLNCLMLSDVLSLDLPPIVDTSRLKSTKYPSQWQEFS